MSARGDNACATRVGWDRWAAARLGQQSGSGAACTGEVEMVVLVGVVRQQWWWLDGGVRAAMTERYANKAKVVICPPICLLLARLRLIMRLQ
jgi:hypothetical protein